MKRWMGAAALVLLLLLPLCACAQSALVDNGSDPNSRLNMRAQPSRDGASLGKFYSGTQVDIVADAGDGWAQVTLGGGNHSLSGYMMRSYLATGADAGGVLDARPVMQVVSPYGTPSVVLRDTPSNSYDAVAMLAVGERVTVIGVSGDYYYVQMADDSVGCLYCDELK